MNPSESQAQSQSHVEHAEQSNVIDDKARKFNPFFTLVHDLDIQDGTGKGEGVTGTTTTGGGGNEKGTTTIHPRNVHYIFSDDDGSEELNAALLRISQSTTRHARSPSNSHTESSMQGSRTSSSNQPSKSTMSNSSSSSATFRKDHPSRSGGNVQEKGEEERVIILDVNDSLTKVTRISSLTPDWQVLSASLENAPSFDPEGNGDGERGVMLKIEGVGIRNLQGNQGVGKEKEKEKSDVKASTSGSGIIKGMGDEEMNSLMEAFDRKMAVLRSVVGNSVAYADAHIGAGEQEGEADEGHEQDSVRRGSRAGSRAE